MSLTQSSRGLALSTWLLSICFVHLLCLDFTVAEKEEWYTAFVNITYLDPVTSQVRTEKTECGRYGLHSPKQDARGFVFMPSLLQERQVCDSNTKFPLPHPNSLWIALISGGNRTYREKIRHVMSLNASAVVIFNLGSNNPNGIITMQHQGTGDVVAIMIPEPKGREIMALLEKNITVEIHINIGTRNLQKYVSRTSVVFISISFIILMIISLAWLVFYYIQRFCYTSARDRNQRRLGDAAKKAISKLQVRTIRKGDKETESEFDNCAVCIEDYKPNDVVRELPCQTMRFQSGGPPTNPMMGASEVTLGENSVVLDPAVRTTSLSHMYHEIDSFPQVGESSEQQPSGCHDSDTSLIMPVELVLSDMDLQSEPEHEDVKSCEVAVGLSVPLREQAVYEVWFVHLHCKRSNQSCRSSRNLPCEKAVTNDVRYGAFYNRRLA
ncbi:RING finger protein 150 [Triplophysa tibetana]|uniref:RING finger protein 150 n=1 Tax=Triplophysa tibetana TaxID=1572043 RepID=A0A5A9PM88_9TELE|nr:RING finger protein 150 [Triplophysa tibetana]